MGAFRLEDYSLRAHCSHGESCLEQLFLFLHSTSRQRFLRDYKLTVRVYRERRLVGGALRELLCFNNPRYGPGLPGEFRPHKESFRAFVELVEQAVELQPLEGVYVESMLGKEINLNHYLFETGWHPHKTGKTLLRAHPDWDWYVLSGAPLVPRFNPEIELLDQLPAYPRFTGQYPKA